MPELPTYQQLLAFDFGMRHIGVAIGQSLTQTASPLAPVTARDGIPDWPALERLFAEWQPDALIVGLPLNMDGSESQLSALARKFGRRLAARFRLPVCMHDERLSSREAREALAERPAGSRGRPPSVHSAAAVVILESWLASPHFAAP